MATPDMPPLNPTWAQRLTELKVFVAKHGHGNVTAQTPGYAQLGSWVSGTRNKAKYGRLSELEMAQLKEAGFLLEVDEFRKSTVFEGWLKELKAFAAKHGNCNVTPKTPGYEKLGSWVSSQRLRRKKGQMYELQI